MPGRFLSVLPLLGVLGSVALAEPVATMTGTPTVKDGDGLLFGKVEVRLQGIAAPEWSRAGGFDPGGEEAKDALIGSVAGREVVCEIDGTVASSNRPVGICYLDGVDLGQLLVAGGFARDCPRFSGGRYTLAEREARRAGADLFRIYDLPEYCG